MNELAFAMEIEKLNLNQKLKTELHKANLTTVSEVLSKPSVELKRILKIDPSEFDELLQVISQAAIQHIPRTAFQIFQENVFGSQTYVRDSEHAIKKLGTGCPVLNRFLRGGLCRQGITEFAGESASGKTQICLQLSLVAQVPEQEGGLNGGVLFICTEDAFPIKRLHQLIESMLISKFQPKAFSDRIFIEHIEDIDGLQACLERKLPIFVSLHNVKLLIIDSIAALFRSQFSSSEAVQRSKKLNVLGHILHKLNGDFGIVTVCVNQISDIVNEGQSTSSNQTYGPSLGLTWSNIVNTRIMLSRTGTNLLQKPISLQESGTTLNFNVNVRKMDVIFSPNLPPGGCYFVVNSSGVHGLDENN